MAKRHPVKVYPRPLKSNPRQSGHKQAREGRGLYNLSTAARPTVLACWSHSAENRVRRFPLDRSDRPSRQRDGCGIENSGERKCNF
jgi:hypothetical protein